MVLDSADLSDDWSGLAPGFKVMEIKNHEPPSYKMELCVVVRRYFALGGVLAENKKQCDLQ